jgi:hypothetical protein
VAHTHTSKSPSRLPHSIPTFSFPVAPVFLFSHSSVDKCIICICAMSTQQCRAIYFIFALFPRRLQRLAKVCLSLKPDLLPLESPPESNRRNLYFFTPCLLCNHSLTLSSKPGRSPLTFRNVEIISSCVIS